MFVYPENAVKEELEARRNALQLLKGSQSRRRDDIAVKLRRRTDAFKVGVTSQLARFMSGKGGPRSLSRDAAVAPSDDVTTETHTSSSVTTTTSITTSGDGANVKIGSSATASPQRMESLNSLKYSNDARDDTSGAATVLVGADISERPLVGHTPVAAATALGSGRARLTPLTHKGIEHTMGDGFTQSHGSAHSLRNTGARSGRTQAAPPGLVIPASAGLEAAKAKYLQHRENSGVSDISDDADEGNDEDEENDNEADNAGDDGDENSSGRKTDDDSLLQASKKSTPECGVDARMRVGVGVGVGSPSLSARTAGKGLQGAQGSQGPVALVSRKTPKTDRDRVEERGGDGGDSDATEGNDVFAKSMVGRGQIINVKNDRNFGNFVNTIQHMPDKKGDEVVAIEEEEEGFERPHSPNISKLRASPHFSPASTSSPPMIQTPNESTRGRRLVPSVRSLAGVTPGANLVVASVSHSRSSNKDDNNDDDDDDDNQEGGRRDDEDDDASSEGLLYTPGKPDVPPSKARTRLSSGGGVWGAGAANENSREPPGNKDGCFSGVQLFEEPS